MKQKSFFLVLLLSFFLFSCGGGGSESDEADSTATQEVVSEELPDEMLESQPCGFPIESKENFLSYTVIDDTPKTFTSNDGVYIFFRPDGTMAGGSGDESTVWEAKWEYKNNQIIITVTAQPSQGKALSGAYNVEMFPDDGALILNCVDYYVEY